MYSPKQEVDWFKYQKETAVFGWGEQETCAIQEFFKKHPGKLCMLVCKCKLCNPRMLCV